MGRGPLVHANDSGVRHILPPNQKGDIETGTRVHFRVCDNFYSIEHRHLILTINFKKFKRKTPGQLTFFDLDFYIHNILLIMQPVFLELVLKIAVFD